MIYFKAVAIAQTRWSRITGKLDINIRVSESDSVPGQSNVPNTAGAETRSQNALLSIFSQAHTLHLMHRTRLVRP
jgi:hypothetical protein